MTQGATVTFNRWVGRYSAGRPGPVVLVCGGIHGNEPSGVIAAQRVMERVERSKPPLRGELWAVAGNLAALAQRRRFLERDLNRCWLKDDIEALREKGPGGDRAERTEQFALLEIIDEAVARGGGLVCLDLHTTSGETPPFTLTSDSLRNRRIAFGLPVSVILGLEESVDGTLLEYLTEQGHLAAVVEAGQHHDPSCVDTHEAVIWLGLCAVGVLDRHEVPDYEAWRRRLKEASRGMPRVVELRHRHEIRNGDGFTMKPGYRGFQRVAEGEAVAHDAKGDIRAPETGRLLMPHYQELGNDGFFLIRPVSRFWMGLSRVLRTLRLGVLLPLLPGVRRHPTKPGALLVNPKVARVYVREIFHLFGFRVRRPEGDLLVFSRRRQR